MERILIIGAGGLSKIVVDILKPSGQYKIEGLIDRKLSDIVIEGIKVIGTDKDLPRLFKNGLTRAVVAIGCVSAETNVTRMKRTEAIKDIGFDLINVVHKDAYISRTARMGTGNIIVGGCYIGPDVNIGSGVILHPFVSIEHDSVIGDYTHMAQGSKAAGEVRTGRASFIGMGANIIQGAVLPDKAFVKSGSNYK